MKVRQVEVLLSTTTRLNVKVISGSTRAPAVIWLHHGIGDGSSLRELPELVASRTQSQSIVYDRPGHGFSTTGCDRVVLRADIVAREQENLASMISLLGLKHEPLVLIGHGTGASIALAHAISTNVAGVIAIAPRVVPEQRLIDGVKAMQGSGQLFDSWQQLWSRDISEEFDLRPSLRHLSCPVLVIQGENDELGTIEAQIDPIVNNSPHPVTVQMVPNAGHFDILTQQRKVRRGSTLRTVLNTQIMDRIVLFIKSLP